MTISFPAWVLFPILLVVLALYLFWKDESDPGLGGGLLVLCGMGCLLAALTFVIGRCSK